MHVIDVMLLHHIYDDTATDIQSGSTELLIWCLCGFSGSELSTIEIESNKNKQKSLVL